MKLRRYRKNPILIPDPKRKWEAGTVFNCGVIYDGAIFHMVYRAVASGFKPRVGGGYRNFISSIGYATSQNGIHFKKSPEPLIRPRYAWERFGCEDPRITKFGNIYYIFYTALSRPAYSGKDGGIRIALATTKDFKRVQKYGIVGPDMKSKAAALFPEKMSGKIGVLLTLQPDTPFSSIVCTFFETVEQLLHPGKSYWKKILSSLDEYVVLGPPKNAWRGPEVGAPPIKTKRGWLLIYCGPSQEAQWSISAALLDLKNPRRIIAQTKKPILEPKKKYELKGFVPNVTFPSGALMVNDRLFIYYGAADSACCLATRKVDDLLNSLHY